MTIADIQRALLGRGHDLGRTGADGVFGTLTRKAIQAELGQHKTVLAPTANPATWNDARLAIAAEQLIMCLGGVPCGTVDGVIGNQTRIARELWAKGQGGAVPSIPTRPVLRPCHTLVWHCTATPEGKEFTRAQIDAMHRARGFAQIGYHKIIHLDGSVSEGRPESIAGAHVEGHNIGTLGYSYVGGLDAKGKAKDTRTPAQKATMIRLTQEAIARYGLRAVVGHRDLSPDRDHDGQIEPHEWVKVCPCFDAIPEYGALLKKAA